MWLNYYSAMHAAPLDRNRGAIVAASPARQLERLRVLARFLDTAIAVPGTKFRFGFDAIIGLVPFLGDAISALLSVYIIAQAARLGTPKSTLTRMIANVGIDTLIGEIPLIGDLFDAGFKSNVRNLALLESHINQPAASRSQSRLVVGLVVLGLLVLVVGLFVLGIVVAEYIMRSLA
jgi:uncharacterized protein DUF4112